jgi:hypothetical protein
MTIYSLLAKKEYTDADGALRKNWYKAGFVKETDAGGRYLTLYHQPDTTFIMVPQDDKELVIEFSD